MTSQLNQLLYPSLYLHPKPWPVNQVRGQVKTWPSASRGRFCMAPSVGRLGSNVEACPRVMVLIDCFFRPCVPARLQILASGNRLFYFVWDIQRTPSTTLHPAHQYPTPHLSICHRGTAGPGAPRKPLKNLISNVTTPKLMGHRLYDIHWCCHVTRSCPLEAGMVTLLVTWWLLLWSVGGSGDMLRGCG